MTAPDREPDRPDEDAGPDEIRDETNQPPDQPHEPEDDDLDSMVTMDSAVLRRPDPESEPERPATDDLSTMARMPEDPFEEVASLPAGAPTEIAGFVLKGIIGAGGMGTVYLAMQTRPRRPVAVKVMKSGVASPIALRRFEFESQMLARLTHPGIAQIYEAGTWDDDGEEIPYFAMEYVPNHRLLDDYCEAHRLTPRKIVELFLPVCRGVGAGHSKGIIHRDLKPGNVLVSTDGRPKIIDFGVARSTDSDQRLTMQTDVHAIVGTLQYMAPEQCAGDVLDLDTSADVYSLGVILYELLAGQLPYEVSGPITSAIRTILEAKPDRLTNVKSAISGDLAVIVEKAMAKERSDRYRTAAELGDDLHRWLNDEPIVAVPPTIMTSFKRLVRRNKPLVGAIMGMAALIVIAVVGGIMALVNRNLALETQNELLAEQSEKRAMVGDLITFFMRDTFDAIVPLANSQEAREQVVNISLDYLERLRAQAGEDPSLQRMLAEGLQQAGINRWSLRSGNRGDIEDAVAKWEESLEIADALYAASRRDTKSLVLSIRGRSLLFDAYRRSGRQDDMIAQLEQAEALAVMLPAPMSDMDQGRLLMGVLLDRSRVVPEEADPEADPAFARMLGLVDELNEAFEGDSRIMRDGTLAWNRLARALSQRGDYEKALHWYGRSLETRQAMLKGREDTNTARRDVNTSRRGVAEQLMGLERPEEAIVIYRDDIVPTQRALVADSPSDIRARDDLAKGLFEYGVCLIWGGRAADAVAPLAEARIGWGQAAERVRGDRGSDQQVARLLGNTEIALAEAYLAAGEVASARAAIDRGAGVVADARAQWPEAPQFIEMEARASGVRARVLESAGKLVD